MFSITLIGLTLSASVQPWKRVAQREREADLLAYGMEIQRAIGAYSTRMKAGRVMPVEVYPHTLDELTRQPAPLLRKVYRDPMTGGPFELVRAPTGGVMGVRSRSVTKPIRQHEFPDAVRHFDGMKRYRDWVFQHPNASGSTWPLQGVAGGPPAVTGPQPSATGPAVPGGPMAPSPSGSGSEHTMPGFPTQPAPSPPADVPDGQAPIPPLIETPPPSSSAP